MAGTGYLAFKVRVAEVLSEASELTPERLRFEAQMRIEASDDIRADVQVFLSEHVGGKDIDHLKLNELKALLQFIFEREAFYKELLSAKPIGKPH